MFICSCISSLLNTVLIVSGPISRVLATKYHKGTDCRFLNFKRGDVIFVYHKLSGKRDDLWAGAVSNRTRNLL